MEIFCARSHTVGHGLGLNARPITRNVTVAESKAATLSEAGTLEDSDEHSIGTHGALWLFCWTVLRKLPLHLYALPTSPQLPNPSATYEAEV